MGRVLVGALHIFVFETEPMRDGLHQAARILDLGAARTGFARDEAGILPDRLAVLAPIEREGPARQALPGVPLALAVVQEAAGGETRPQAPDQAVAEPAFRRAHGFAVPFRRFEIVDRHEGRLAAGREPHVGRAKLGIDLPAEGVERLPGFVREGCGDARRFGDARHFHRVMELDLARVEGAADGRGRAVVRRRGQGQVALAAQQSGRGVEADPAGARQIDLGPGVQVREIVPRAERAGHRVDVGFELDQVTRDEAGREADAAQDLHHEPGRVAAGSGLQRERLLRLLNAGLHADHIGDLARQAGVDVDQDVDRPLRFARDGGQECLQLRPRDLRLEIGRDLGAGLGVVREGEGFGRGLDEEVEGIDHRHVGREVHLDPEGLGLLREDQPGQPVAVRILLPIDEMIGGCDLERVTWDRRPAMRGRTKTDDLRTERDRTVIVVICHVIDRGAHGHRGLLEVYGE